MSVVSDESSERGSPVANLFPSARSNSSSSEEPLILFPPPTEPNFEVTRPDLEDPPADTDGEHGFRFDVRFTEDWTEYTRSTELGRLLQAREAEVISIRHRIEDALTERTGALPIELRDENQAYHDGTLEQRRQIYRSSPRYQELLNLQHQLILLYYRTTIDTDILREWLARRWCRETGRNYGEFVSQIYGEQARCHHYAREIQDSLRRDIGEAEVPNNAGNQWIRAEWVRLMEIELANFDESLTIDPVGLLEHSDTEESDGTNPYDDLGSESEIDLDDEPNPYPDIPHYDDGPHTVSLPDTDDME